MKYIISILLVIFFISCSNDDKEQQKVQQEDQENSADTNLTPEEKFSSSILIDFLDNSEDDDLADFLESEIYKMGANYTGASVVEISPAIWFLLLEKEGITKNYLIQKFVDFKTNEYYFQLNETALSITEIITKSRNKIPAGE